MTIINATAEHVPAIAALERQCFPADPWPEDVIGRLHSRFILAMEGDELLGYGVLSSILDEGSLDNIAAAPSHRREGVGAALMEEIVRRGREKGLAFITLEVRAGNEPAIGLYKKYGFAPVGRRKNYYENPREDAILMTLVI